MSIHVREVVLEFLRHGYPHNQLLSPLTRYLALCGSHPAAPVSVPFEHRELQHLLQHMRYEAGAKGTSARDSAYARERLSRSVTELLEQVPALPHEGRVGDGQILHLRLMITPQELAMLPFELADPPSGFESGGQPFLIGPTPDVVLTREIRRAGSVPVRVPQRPRILLVAADPNGHGIPFEDHRRALVQALDPWIRPQVREGAITKDIGAHLVVLERASLEEIREQCIDGGFTHVHILAHGDVLDDAGQEGYGLALWDRRKQGKLVADGQSLARALRPPTQDGTWAAPWCVVLCTCDSSNIGGVIHPTASLAHALHVAGVPFVLASQYPLTFGAANTLAQTFYPLELRGEDPRRTLRDLRHAIASRMHHTHDWASLVAYANWPADLVTQLDAIRVMRAFAQLEAAQDWADRAIARAELRTPSSQEDSPENAILQRSLKLVGGAIQVLMSAAEACEQERRAIKKLGARNEITKHERQHRLGSKIALLTEIYGLLGSANKRRARLYDHQGRAGEARNAMSAAMHWYLQGVALKAPEHWTACQSFVLIGLGGGEDGWAGDDDRKRGQELWRAALDAASRALKDPADRIWAVGTMIEVELWRPVFDTGEPLDDGASARAATDFIDELIKVADSEPFPLKSTVRQLRRYRDWWGAAGYVDPAMLERVEQVLARAEPHVAVDDGAADLGTVEPALDDDFAEATVDQVLGQGDVNTVMVGKTGPGQSTFRVQMLPARQGDALWIEYGSDPDTRRILVDGGFRTTIRTVENRIRELAESDGGACHFELGVVSHIDADHIEGLIELLGSDLPVTFGDFWFNGRKHLDTPAVSPSLDDDVTLGGKHGLFLDTALELCKVSWNMKFKGGPVVVPDAPGKLPVIDLAGDMRLTLMSPTSGKLATLARRWDSEVRKAGLAGATFKQVLSAMDRLHYRLTEPGMMLLGRQKPSGPLDIESLLEAPDGRDTAPANGSSIAFLAEYDGRSCLLMADAHPDVMVAAIDRIAGKGKRLVTDAVKLSHHGSANNVTLELLRRIDSRVFMISTNGGGSHYHPDRAAIAKLIAGDWREIDEAHHITLLFNYRTEYTEIWDDEELMERFHYSVEYALSGDILELNIGRP
jgi:beta-lactamase superfamily II metal-dependent hydrolase